jgi:hypothetical protein
VEFRVLLEMKQRDLARIEQAERGRAEKQRQPLPTLCKWRKGWATRKIKGRTKTSQLQDESPERVDRVRRVVNKGRHACENVGHPPRRLRSELVPSQQPHDAALGD